MKDHHSLGSATTYARRISLAALLGVCPQGEDDDGEKAMEEVREAENQRKAARKKTPAKKKKHGEAYELAKCKIIIDQVDGAEDWLRGKGIDPGDPPPNIRDKILALGPGELAKKIEEKRKAEEAEEIIDEADKVEPVKDEEAAA